MSLYIETTDLVDICNKLMDGHVSYVLGSKAPHFDTDAAKIKTIDCSGFVQYVLYNASNKTAILKSGSYYQNQWCLDHKLDKVAYSTAAESDGWLRLGYFAASKTQSSGHIWLILGGKTLESHGGKGPDRREWNTNVLTKNVTACYKVAQLFSQFHVINWNNVG